MPMPSAEILVALLFEASSLIWFVYLIMRFLLPALFALLQVLPFNKNNTEIKRINFSGLAQGTTYSILYYAERESVTKVQIDSILGKLDSSLSLYKSFSLISRFNRSSEGIEGDEHLLAVAKRSLEIFRDTRGIFDITVKPLVDAWGFGTSKSSRIPTGNEIARIRKCIGSSRLSIKGKQFIKRDKCIQVDMNGIAQGYSVDVIARFLEENSISSYMVELGGEIRTKGEKPEHKKMRIGIEAPSYDPLSKEEMEKVIIVDSGAVTTSGSYKKYRLSMGRKLTHLIDPRSGYPVDNELISVTVYAPDAITADGYDNALMAMGLIDAMKFVEERPFLAANFIYRKKDGSVSDTASSRFRHFIQR